VLIEALKRLRLLPVIVIDRVESAVGLARALSEGGLAAAEVTLRTPAALDAIRVIARECPDVLLGAGTVLSARQVDDAVDAGAKFVVSPGLSEAVVKRAWFHGIDVFPGVATPTEIGAALQMGLTTMKLFPAEALGGVEYLRAVAAPYGKGVSFMPTGGVNAANVGAYLKSPSVVACGGSWMAPAERVSAADWEFVRSETARAVEAARA
jgi:2-dehydro-3-deoxyphosphogluconate aldolase/(4S)-4-hydroxy-2-oxoglutarate aldolase